MHFKNKLLKALEVAPPVGAWIETQFLKAKTRPWEVAPPPWARGFKLAKPDQEENRGGVAPPVGAWIETLHSIEE